MPCRVGDRLYVRRVGASASLPQAPTAQPSSRAFLMSNYCRTNDPTVIFVALTLSVQRSVFPNPSQNCFAEGPRKFTKLKLSCFTEHLRIQDPRRLVPWEFMFSHPPPRCVRFTLSAPNETPGHAIVAQPGCRTPPQFVGHSGSSLECFHPGE